jgi:hypothetical protein
MVHKDDRLALTLLAMCIGTVAAAFIRTAKTGVGYWLGVTGGVMFLFILLYPLFKYRYPLFFKLKKVFWFHVVLGTLGPMIIIAHSGGHLHSLNATVCFLNMLLLVISGSATLYTRSKKDGTLQEIVSRLSRNLLKIHSPVVWGFVATTLIHIWAVHWY